MYGNWFVTLLISVLVAMSAAWVGGWPHDPDQRIRELNKEIAQQPDDARLYLRRGELYRQRSDMSLALSDYDRAAQLDPDLSDVDFARALVHLDTEQQTQRSRSRDRRIWWWRSPLLRPSVWTVAPNGLSTNVRA